MGESLRTVWESAGARFFSLDSALGACENELSAGKGNCSALRAGRTSP
jgi:hypothetical protein